MSGGFGFFSRVFQAGFVVGRGWGRAGWVSRIGSYFMVILYNFNGFPFFAGAANMAELSTVETADRFCCEENSIVCTGES